MINILKFKTDFKKIEDFLKSKRIVIIYGGFSEERGASIYSGDKVYEEISKKMFKVLRIDPLKQDLCKVLDKKNDIAFNCLHGEFGESGHLPAILDYLEIPYTFSGLYPSVVTLDKIYFKSILKKLNISCPDDNYDKHIYHKSEEKVFIHKKIRGGGSIGMHLAKYTRLEKGYFAEEFIEGNLLTLGILEYQGGYIPLGIVEVELNEKTFYDTQAKYETGFSKYNRYNGCNRDKIR